MKKIVDIVSGLFLAIGVVLLVVTYFVHSSDEEFKSHADLVDAKIVDMTGNSQNVNVLITYEYDGETYGPALLGGYSSSMYVGATEQIYVDRNNPSQFSWGRGLAQVICLVLGLVFAGVGGIVFVVRAVSGASAKRLLAEGKRLVGTVECVTQNTVVEVNGQHPWMVVCSWSDSKGDTYRFKSKTLYTDPSEVFKPGDEISIFVDPNNMKKYYVDVDQKMSKIHDL